MRVRDAADDVKITTIGCDDIEIWTFEDTNLNTFGECAMAIAHSNRINDEINEAIGGVNAVSVCHGREGVR